MLFFFLISISDYFIFDFYFLQSNLLSSEIQTFDYSVFGSLWSHFIKLMLTINTKK